MAIWQYALDLIPSSSATVKGADAIYMAQERLAKTRPAIPLELAPAFCDRIGELLPEQTAWARGLRIWGHDQSHDVQVWFDGPCIQEVQLRLDASNPSTSFIKGFCEIARDFDCIFAARDGAIIRPSVDGVMRAVSQSRAMRYARDPKEFLETAVEADRD